MSLIPFVAVALAALATSPRLWGQSPPRSGGDRTAFDEQVRPFLAEHCVGCHNADLQTADLSFETFLADADARAHPDLWEKVSDKLRAGLMPPAGRPAPPPAEVEAVTAWIDDLLAARGRRG